MTVSETEARGAAGGPASFDAFRDIVENLPNMVFVSKAGRILYVNPRVAEVLGGVREDYYAEDFDVRRLVAPESSEAMEENRLRGVRGEDLPPREYTLVKMSGERLDAVVNSRQMLIDGKLLFVGVVTDISECRRAEAALEESRGLYWTLLKTFPDAVTVTDLEGKITEVSERSVDLAGCDGPEDLIGRNAFELIAPEDRDRAVANMRRVLTEGVVHGIEYRLLRKDGSSYTGEMDVALIRDSSGGPKGFVAAVRDITERKRAEEALRESEQRHRELFEGVSDGAMVFSSQGRFVDVNEVALQLLGYSREEFYRLSPADIVHPDFHRTMRENQEKIWGGEPTLVESAHVCKDGRVIPVDVNARRIDFRGEPAILALVRDVTERKRAEEERRRLEERLRESLERERDKFALEVASLKSQIEGRYGLDNMVGQDPKMRAIYETILAVAGTRATVLVQGETGTGKELVARAIHHNSPQRERPLVKVDCGALAENLLESELFGHVRGAFTGAVRDRRGRFELADTGTILLDEIQNLSMPLQSKLLRVVQEGCFEKVGGTETKHVEVRVIATTNEDPEELVAAGKFRKDLYYRLNVVRIKLPPLRERPEDVPLLVLHFIKMFSATHDKSVTGVTKEAVDRLVAHDWPGNIRELENAVEQAVVFARDETIRDEDIRLPEPAEDSPFGRRLRYATGETEARAIGDALRRTGGNKKRAAELLGISRSALYEKLKRYGMARAKS